jgi:hypothetical protein
VENNQYPKNVIAATDILSNHKHGRRARNQGNQQSSKKSWYNSKPKDDDSTPSTITTASKTSSAQNPKEQTHATAAERKDISVLMNTPKRTQLKRRIGTFAKPNSI